MPNTSDGQFEIKMGWTEGLVLEKIMKAGITENGSQVCHVDIHDTRFENGDSEVLFKATFTIRTAGDGNKKTTADVLRAMGII